MKKFVLVQKEKPIKTKAKTVNDFLKTHPTHPFIVNLKQRDLL